MLKERHEHTGCCTAAAVGAVVCFGVHAHLFSGHDMTSPGLSDLLRDYAREHKERARGGWLALAGFDFQIQCYVADVVRELVRPLVGGVNASDGPAEVLFEAFSDEATGSVDDLVCVQMKRTLRRDSLQSALAGFVSLDEFLRSRGSIARFELVAQYAGGTDLEDFSWMTVLPGEAGAVRERLKSGLEQLEERGALLPPRIRPAPRWEAVKQSWRWIRDPFAFVDAATTLCLQAASSDRDAKALFVRIAEEFSRSAKMAPEIPRERFVEVEDFRGAQADGDHSVLLGQSPRIEDLAANRYGQNRPTSTATRGLRQMGRRRRRDERQGTPQHFLDRR